MIEVLQKLVVWFRLRWIVFQCAIRGNAEMVAYPLGVAGC